MREIKFRAWHPKENKMWQDVGTDGYGGIILDTEHMGLQLLKGTAELMQYTGRKDKNGVEIYEGDILLVPDEWTERILDDGSGPRESINHLAPVIFKDGSFGVDIPDKADIYKKGFWAFPVIQYRIGDHPEEWEIIGNIYEGLYGGEKWRL